MKFFCNTKHTKMFLKIKMLTCCLNIDHMTMQPTLKREHDPIQTHLQLIPKWKYIDKNLNKLFIWHYKFLINILILFFKKKYGYLQMCVDYHGLNWFTIKNWYPLPLMSRLDQLNHVKIFTQVYLRGAYSKKWWMKKNFVNKLWPF
jgi:hypothetical protein